jgi:1-deoxy-D-xylulose-5-phosphate reductoisomerase
MPCILNAANEVAVNEFLNENISFTEISEIIEDCMAKVAYIARPSYEDYVETDKETRRIARSIKLKA